MKKFILPVLLLAIIASCKKKDTPTTVAGPYTSLSAAMLTMSVQSKTVTLDASAGGSFYGNSGTRYVFPANAFQTSTGGAVTGSVSVQVSEYLKKSDMLFSSMIPVSNGSSLISGGEINVVASQSGQQLYLQPSMSFQANMPQNGTPVTGMSLFFGNTIDSNNTGAINWNLAKRDSVNATIVYDGDSINIFSDSMGYCNADQFMSNPDYQTFTVTVAGPTIADSTDLLAYAVYDNYNALWGMTERSNNVISEGHVPNIPVHFVVMAVINGYFYGGILGATPASGTNYTVTLTQTDPTTFKTQVDAL